MTKNIFEPYHKEYARHVTSGIFNSGILQIVKVLCQFGSVVILSRLLSPSDFGLIAMASPVVGFVALFQDLGLNQATVQKAVLAHDEVNAFFWINVIGGLVLTFVLFAISPLVGWYYGEPRAALLTAAIGLLVFVSGLGNQHSAILQRRMEFGVLAFTGTLGALSGLIAAVMWASIFKNYWAIYFGMVVGTIVPVVAVWMNSGWRPSTPKLVPGLSHMLKFGAGVTSFNISSFIARNTDNILIGRAWGDHELGLYDRAYKLLLFPLQRIIDPMSGIMIPVLSRLTAEPDRYRSIFLRALSQLALATWPGIIWAIILADTVIPTLLGKIWMDSVPMFIPLACAGILQVVNSLAGWLFISQGRSGEYARWGIVGASTSVLAFLIGLPHGAIGVAIAYSISEFIRTPFLWWYVTRRGPIQPNDLVCAIMPQVISASVSCLALMGQRLIMSDSNPWLILIGGIILSYGVSGITMLLFPDGRLTLKQTLAVGQHLIMHVLPKRGERT